MVVVVVTEGAGAGLLVVVRRVTCVPVERWPLAGCWVVTVVSTCGVCAATAAALRAAAASAAEAAADCWAASARAVASAACCCAVAA